MRFKSIAFDSHWDGVVERFAPICADIVVDRLGDWGTIPLEIIEPLENHLHTKLGVNASFDLLSGQISLHPYMDGDLGTTLEKLTHEMVHGALSQFPQEDEFYDEGYVDYSVLILSRTGLYREFGKSMERAARYNLSHRAQLAKGEDTYHHRRWAGARHAHHRYGDQILNVLKDKKTDRDFNW